MFIRVRLNREILGCKIIKIQKNIERLKGEQVVVTWSGGLDTTGLLAFVMEDLESTVFPIFVNRGQGNYSREKQYFFNISLLCRKTI